jgi:hypothetical protein
MGIRCARIIQLRDTGSPAKQCEVWSVTCEKLRHIVPYFELRIQL